MTQKVTAIFDVGKTNKKFLLFDEHLQVVYQESVQLDEMVDEDGFACEDLDRLTNWIKSTFNRLFHDPRFEIKALNFCTYGASLVHLDADGNILTPLYNYLKPYDPKYYQTFLSKYGPEKEFSISTGAKPDGMLSSGLQLFWLKYAKPEVFNQIRYSLHLPQYLSYLFTGIPLSEFTSIGCHTGLWDFSKNTYHDWVFIEKLDAILPPIASAKKTTVIIYGGRNLSFGIGLHDSSSALIPYLKTIKTRFLLVSTGTWSVTLNPSAQGILTEEELNTGCLNYLTVDGNRVKSSKFMLGKMYDFQLQKLAYHQLILQLVNLQIESIKTAMGGDNITKILVEGGFSSNDVFMHVLANELKNMEVYSATNKYGAALGAAMVIEENEILNENGSEFYSLKKHDSTLRFRT